MHGISADIGLEEAREHLATAGADVLIVGHTHHAFELIVGERRRILNRAALLMGPPL